jgi:membrane protein involved in colicin uptake
MATKKKKPAAPKKKPAPAPKKAAPAPKKKAAPAPKKKAAAAGPTNPKILKRKLLDDMVGSDYYPQNLVKKGQKLLLDLAAKIEAQKPAGTAVYKLTHATTEAFNDLQEEFFEADSELETVAREAIGADVDFILKTYGYDVDIEEAIAPRDW